MIRLNDVNGQFVFVYYNERGVYKSLVKDIIFFQREGRGIYMHTRINVVKIDLSLQRLKEQLGWLEFVYLNQSILINLAYLAYIEGDMATLINGMKIEISRSKLKPLREKIINGD